jgi:hypothetical protein
MTKTDEPKALCPDCGNYSGGKCPLYQTAKETSGGTPVITVCSHYNNANLPNSDIAIPVEPKKAEAVVKASIDEMQAAANATVAPPADTK